MDIPQIKAQVYSCRCAFSYFASMEIITLLSDMQYALIEQNNEKLIDIYFIFLQKCLILRRELQDHLGRPIVEPDLERYIEETKKVLPKQEKARDSGSCAGCNIF